MSKASLFFNENEYPISNFETIVVPKSSALVQIMAVSLFGNLHLVFKNNVNVEELISKLLERDCDLKGFVRFYQPNKKEDIKVYDIHFASGKIKGIRKIYNTAKKLECTIIDIEPRFQKIGKVIKETGCSIINTGLWTKNIDMSSDIGFSFN